MFSAFKKDNNNSNKDKELLIAAMDEIIKGNYNPIDTSVFDDPAYAQKLNDVIKAFKLSNNNFVMRMNEAMEYIGDSSCVKTMLEQLSLQTESIEDMTASSKDLESSINSISEEISYIRDNTSAAIDVSQKSVTNMSDTISAVSESVIEINSINEKVQDFHEKINQISSIIDLVKKIANQSGLLALNASIEAARAGEAGKGFAVVANQVKELSSNTTHSADTIVSYVTELQTSINELIELVNNTTSHLRDSNEKVQKSVVDMNEMSDHMNLINDRINNIYDAVNTQSLVTQTFVKSIDSMVDSYQVLQDDCMSTGNHLYKIGRYVDTARSDMARGFSELTMQDWIRVFQIDHLIFTWRVYNNLEGYEHLRIEQLNNPKGCKLGKWAASQTDPKITNSQEFKDVMMYHENIHKYSCDSWYAAEDGDKKTAMRNFNIAFENFQNFYKAIDKFKALLRRLGYTDETHIKVFRP